MAGMQLHGLIFAALLRPQTYRAAAILRQLSQTQNEAPGSIQNEAGHAHRKNTWSDDMDAESYPMEIQGDNKYMACTCHQHLAACKRESMLYSKSQPLQPAQSSMNKSGYGVEKSKEDFQLYDVNDNTCITHDFTKASRETHKQSRLWFYLPWMLFFLGNWLVQSCHVLITVLTPVRANWLGIENHLAALLVSIYGVSSGVCRYVMVFLH